MSRPIFPPIEEEELEQRSASLYKRQWQQLDIIAEREKRSRMDTLRRLVAWAMQEWEIQSRGGKK